MSPGFPHAHCMMICSTHHRSDERRVESSRRGHVVRCLRCGLAQPHLPLPSAAQATNPPPVTRLQVLADVRLQPARAGKLPAIDVTPPRRLHNSRLAIEHSKRVQAANMRGFPGRPPCPEPFRGSRLGPGKARRVSSEPLLMGISLTKSSSLSMLEMGAIHGADHVFSRMGTSSMPALPTLSSRPRERLPAQGERIGRGQHLLAGGSQMLDAPVPVLPW